jgi:hypothetical protein
MATLNTDESPISEPGKLIELFQKNGLTIIDPAETGRSPIPGEISIHSIYGLAQQGGLTIQDVEWLAHSIINEADWRDMPSTDFDAAMQNGMGA